MKRLPSLLAILFISSSLFAQSKIEIGLEGGPNRSNLYGNSFVMNYNKPKFAFYSGLSLQYNFSRHLSLRTGLGLERKGVVDNRDIFDTSNTKIGELKYHSNFNYLSAPIMLRYTMGKKTKFFVNAGTYIAYLISQKEINDARPTFGKSEYSNYDVFNKIDIGFSTGVGISQPLSNALSVSFELRNNLGLTDINDYTIINNQGIKFNSFNGLFGLNYSLGKKEKVLPSRF